MSQTHSKDPWTNLSEDYSNKNIETDVVNISGVSLQLSDCDQIGRGGAAIVYLIKSGKYKDKALKLYHEEELSKRGSMLQAKIQAMIQAQPENRDMAFEGHVTPQFVWPEVEVLDKNEEFVGFVLPYLEPSSYYILSEYLYETDKLDTKHQSITERMQVCRNLASAVLSLHKAGHYFVDMKPQNIFVHKEQSTVTFIDCDGFSIMGGEFPCYQYSPSYIAPEYINKRPEEELSHSSQQDEFVLAVLLFQILDFGNHPYSCRILDDSLLPPDGEQTLNSRVANEFYPYDNKISGISPIAHSIYQYWPDRLRRLFDKSFCDAARPSAEKWYSLLHSYIEGWDNTFIKCEKHPEDMVHRHFKGFPCYVCSEFGQVGKPELPNPPELETPQPPPEEEEGATDTPIQPEKKNDSGGKKSFGGIFNKYILVIGSLLVVLPVILFLGWGMDGLWQYKFSSDSSIIERLDPWGLFYIGEEFERKGEYDAANRLFRLAAEQGSADGQNRLGLLYEKGFGEAVRPDLEWSDMWYRKAADQGHAKAQYRVGLNCYYGNRVTGDKGEGIKWLKKAAAQGEENAQKMLGEIALEAEDARQL